MAEIDVEAGEDGAVVAGLDVRVAVGHLPLAAAHGANDGRGPKASPHRNGAPRSPRKRATASNGAQPRYSRAAPRNLFATAPLTLSSTLLAATLEVSQVFFF